MPKKSKGLEQGVGGVPCSAQLIPSFLWLRLRGNPKVCQVNNSLREATHGGTQPGSGVQAARPRCPSPRGIPAGLSIACSTVCRHTHHAHTRPGEQLNVPEQRWP